MKILLISNMYPSDEFPSYGVFVKNTEAILKDEQHDVSRIVMQKRTGKFAKLIAYTKHYFRILARGLTGSHDVIYVHYAAHNAFPLLLLKKLKPQTRIITNVHGSDVVPEVPSQEKFQGAVKALLEASDRVITPSYYYERLVKEQFGTTTPIRVFPSGGVNQEVFHPRPSSRVEDLNEFSLSISYKYFGYVGRLDVGKGWDHLIHAYAVVLASQPQLKTSHRLVVVGSGKDEIAFKQLVQNLGLEEFIQHIPLVSQQQLAKLYPLFELFIFPTTRKGESLGLVGLESMASGTPILASRIGGILDYVKNGQNSWLFEPGNAKDLSEKWQEVYKLPQEQFETVRAQALITADAYNPKHLRKQLTAVFQEL